MGRFPYNMVENFPMTQNPETKRGKIFMEIKSFCMTKKRGVWGEHSQKQTFLMF